MNLKYEVNNRKVQRKIVAGRNRIIGMEQRNNKIYFSMRTVAVIFYIMQNYVPSESTKY